VNFKVTVYIFIMKSDTGTYWSLGGRNFRSLVPIKELLETFCFHHEKLQAVMVYIVIMTSDTGTYWSLGGSKLL